VRFLFLGTGTSSGIPAIGCDCAVCTSSDPRDNRLRTSAAVRWTDERGSPRAVVFDTGPDFRQQVLRFKVARCDAVLFTHNHVDHTFGLDELRRFNVVMDSSIDIYAEPPTLEHLYRVYKHIFDRINNVNDSFVATLLAHRIEEAQVRDFAPIVLFGMEFRPIRLIHGKLPVLGFRVEPTPALVQAWAASGMDLAASPFPLAYCTDVSGIPTESWARLRGLRTLVLDALRHRAHPTHFTLAQAVNAAGNIGAERTYFVHMAHDLAHETTQADLPESMFLAWDGLELGE
jgi:phosphoribosyl 1,2-cyclic phosphate phosphodiesterase